MFYFLQVARCSFFGNSFDPCFLLPLLVSSFPIAKVLIKNKIIMNDLKRFHVGPHANRICQQNLMFIFFL